MYSCVASDVHASLGWRAGVIRICQVVVASLTQHGVRLFMSLRLYVPSPSHHGLLVSVALADQASFCGAYFKPWEGCTQRAVQVECCGVATTSGRDVGAEATTLQPLLTVYDPSGPWPLDTRRHRGSHAYVHL